MGTGITVYMGSGGFLLKDGSGAVADLAKLVQEGAKKLLPKPKDRPPNIYERDRAEAVSHRTITGAIAGGISKAMGLKATHRGRPHQAPAPQQPVKGPEPQAPEKPKRKPRKTPAKPKAPRIKFSPANLKM